MSYLATFVFAVIVTVTVTFFLYHTGLFNQIQHANATRSIQKQQAIANFGVLGRHTVESRLRARAIPNQRLAKAFGIVSSFTTEDPTIHYEFLRRASIDIDKMGPEHCVEFFNAAKLALDRTIHYFGPPVPPGHQYTLPLARVTRAFVLITTLNKFFSINPLSVDVDAAIQASEAINRLWVQSRIPEQAGQSADQTLLQHSLERLLPGRFPCEPKDHPLNIIMPAYETMWRAVLLTFVEAGFRTRDETASRQFQRVVEAIPECFGGADRWYGQVALDCAKVRRSPLFIFTCSPYPPISSSFFFSFPASLLLTSGRRDCACIRQPSVYTAQSRERADGRRSGTPTWRSATETRPSGGPTRCSSAPRGGNSSRPTCGARSCRSATGVTCARRLGGSGTGPSSYSRLCWRGVWEPGNQGSGCILEDGTPSCKVVRKPFCLMVDRSWRTGCTWWVKIGT